MDANDILNGNFEEIEDAVVISESKSNIPELAGINDKEIRRVYPELKLKVTEIHIDTENQYEVTAYTKDLLALSRHIEKVRKEEKQPLMDEIAKVEAPYKKLFALVNELSQNLKSNLTKFQLEQRKIAEAKAEQERKEKEKELKRIEAEKKALEEAKQDSVDDEEIQAYENAAQELEQKSLELEETEIVVQKTNVQAMGATAYLKKQPKYEIVDSTKVPREYCEPSKGLIWEAVRSGTKEIPGVRIWEEESTGIR